jgi:hypothetical protein
LPPRSAWKAKVLPLNLAFKNKSKPRKSRL